MSTSLEEQSTTRSEALIRAHLESSARVKRDAADACAADIARAGEMLVAALTAGGKILFCGNGGSAADCQHIAAEFVSSLDHTILVREALPAIALTTDTSFLTAAANDFGFEGIFVRQVQALGRTGDVLVAISTSGNSANVVAAVDAARRQGLQTVALTGEGGGQLATSADVAVRIPSRSTQHIQEAHIAVGHILCALVEDTMFGR